MKRLLITGSRSFTNVEGMEYYLRGAYRTLKRQSTITDDFVPVTLVSGSALGADMLAEDIWSANVGEQFIERWPARDFPHPLKRNDHMVSLGADMCVAFPMWCVQTKCMSKVKHYSHGTAYTIRKSQDSGIDTRILVP